MSKNTPTDSIQLTASIGLVIGGIMWGVYWIPVRVIADMGLPGVWAGVVLYLAALIVLLPIIWTNRESLLSKWQTLLFVGLLTGAAFSLFTTSLSMTDVIRAILLFYLTPIWGTLLGLIVLGERLTVTRVLALVLGLCGLLVVLGLGQKFPWPKNIGDWLALSSGMFWAYGSMKLYQMEKIAASEQVLAFLFGSLFVSGFILLVGGPELAAKVDIKVVFNAMPYALLLTIYLIPMFYLTIWPATLLAPGRVGVLLMSEIVVGVITAAIISGEPFGIREALGTIMIVSAALLEILGGRKIT